MNLLLLAVSAIALSALVALVIGGRRPPRALRIGAAVGLLGLAGFSVLGFLASDEVAEPVLRLRWKCLHASVGTLAVVGAGGILLGRRVP